MTQEDKELILTDLSARLRYGVKVLKLNEPESAFEVYAINIETTQISFFKYKGKSLEIYNTGLLISPNNFLRFKPYLRPMSSMTDEEKKELKKLCEEDLYEFVKFIKSGQGLSRNRLYMFDKLRQLEFCLSHHFDFRGLIEEGLALEAPEGMYNIKENLI